MDTSTTDQNQPEFVPRANLQRTLTYRNYMRWVFYTLTSLSGFLLLGTIYLLILTQSSGLSWGLGLFVFSLMLGALAWFLVRPLTQTQVHVFRDRLEIERLGPVEVIPYESITQIELTHIPFLTGWFLIKSQVKNLKITVVLERSDYIIESIAAARPELIPISEVEAFRKTAIAVDHIWAAFSDRFSNARLLFYKYALSPLLAINLVVLYAFISEIPFAFEKLGYLVVGVYAFVLMVALVFWWISSLVHIVHTADKLKKNPNYRIRDLAFEKKMDFWSQNIQRVALLAFVVFVCLSL